MVGGALVVSLLTPGPVLAQYVGTPTPTVASSGQERCPRGSTDPACIVVRAASAERGGDTLPVTGDTLPVTGGDLAGLAAVGAGGVALGAVLVRRGRGRSRGRPLPG